MPLAIADSLTVNEVAHMVALGEHTVRDYINCFLRRGVTSLVYKCTPRQPAKLTKTSRQALTALIDAGSQAAGYASGCWSHDDSRVDSVPKVLKLSSKRAALIRSSVKALKCVVDEFGIQS